MGNDPDEQPAPNERNERHEHGARSGSRRWRSWAIGAGAGVLAIAVGAGVGLWALLSDDAPSRDELIGLVRESDPSLDRDAAGCVADELTESLGAGDAADALRTRPPVTLPPEQTDAVVTAALACGGAGGIRLPAVDDTTTATEGTADATEGG